MLAWLFPLTPTGVSMGGSIFREGQRMKLRALGSVLSALVACGLVSMVVTDPLTTVEAVPESSPSTAPVAPVARNVDLPRDATYVTEYDPLSAATPEVAGQSEVPVPLPTAPKTITKEKVKPIGKANPDALLTRPVNGRTTSKFGMRFHPVLKVWKLHTGLDWGVPCGTPVGAAAAGTVVRTGWAGGNGIQVKIDHGMLAGHRVVTTYNHLSSIGVSVGQKVQPLDGIGRVGSTGYSTGCHMHFEVIADGQFTDPEPWLNGDPVVVDLSKMAYAVPSNSPTSSPSVSPTPTKSPSASTPPSPSPSATPTPTPSQSPTPSPSPTPSTTPKPTPSTTPSTTPTKTPSKTPSVSASPSKSPSVEASPTPEVTPTVPSPTAEPSKTSAAPEPTTQPSPPATTAAAPEATATA